MNWGMFATLLGTRSTLDSEYSWRLKRSNEVAVAGEARGVDEKSGASVGVASDTSG